MNIIQSKILTNKLYPKSTYLLVWTYDDEMHIMILYQ